MLDRLLQSFLPSNEDFKLRYRLWFAGVALIALLGAILTFLSDMNFKITIGFIVIFIISNCINQTLWLFKVASKGRKPS
jgi:hypothetical protein